ncbi:nylA [Symbiodinium microadriaticum]|nr:nylA [Symbiodinium microadriaticum]
MGQFKEYEDYDALGLADVIAKGDISAEEVLEEAIERTEARNPKINAVTHKWYDEARAAIKDGLPDGPFKGVPFLLKDLNLYYPGRVTTNGSRLFKDYVPDTKSTLVQRYEDAGLVLFGKSNTPEFGLTAATEPTLFGPTRNPWNLDHTPGGSSGGASAAVAAGLLPMANASDGGGSIRIPAACTGLFGMKPTRARTPLGPHVGEGWGSLSISHAVSWSVRDNAALLDATHGPDLGDPYYAPHQEGTFLDAVSRAPGKLRVAMYTDAPSGTPVDPEVKAAVQDAAKLLESLGHVVEEAMPQYDVRDMGLAQMYFMAASAKLVTSSRAEELGVPVDNNTVEKVTLAMIENAGPVTADQMIWATRMIHKTGRDLARFMNSYDVILSPTLGQKPVTVGTLNMDQDDLGAYFSAVTEFVSFTGLYNVTGQPSMSVPLAMSSDGLPIGIMFTGRFGDENTLFSLAGQLEQAAPWADRRPPSLD